MSEINFDDFELPQEVDAKIKEKFNPIIKMLLTKIDLIISILVLITIFLYGMIKLKNENFYLFLLALLLVNLTILKTIFIALFKKIKSLKKQ